MKLTSSLRSHLSIAALTAGLAVASVLPAEASSFTGCVKNNSNIGDNVTGVANCTVSTTANQDFLNSMTVNQNGGFFGKTDWAFGGKIGETAGYTGQGNGAGQSGTWNIPALIQQNFKDVMLVFKSGQGTTLVGYLLNEGVTSGSWSSPFEKAFFGFNGGSIKDVSHVSVYYREAVASNPPGDVPSSGAPEPTTMLGAALVGGVVAARKKLQHKAIAQK
jgi:hypothetical protein